MLASASKRTVCSDDETVDGQESDDSDNSAKKNKKRKVSISANDDDNFVDTTNNDDDDEDGDDENDDDAAQQDDDDNRNDDEITYTEEAYLIDAVWTLPNDKVIVHWTNYNRFGDMTIQPTNEIFESVMKTQTRASMAKYPWKSGKEAAEMRKRFPNRVLNI